VRSHYHLRLGRTKKKFKYMQTGRQAGRQADRQTDRRYIYIYIYIYILYIYGKRLI